MKSKNLVIALLLAIVYLVVGCFSVFSTCVLWKYIAGIILIFDGIVCAGVSIYAFYKYKKSVERFIFNILCQ